MSAVSTRTEAVPAPRSDGGRAARFRTATLVTWVALAAIAVVLGFNVFSGLGTWNIAPWDESRHAVNAYEMLQRGDWIGNTWRGQLDYFNLKPPLSMWAEMLSYQAFGYTTFAFRLPAALATFLTVGAVSFFSYRAAGRVAAVVSALALVTSSHFLLTHNARTGDPDALFLLGTTVALLALIAAPRHPRLLLLATSAMSFAFLAKSFHVGLLVVLAVPFLILTRRASRIRLRHVLLSLLGFVPVLAWVIVRFAYDGTAFIGNMFLVDVLHRTEAPAEGNTAAPQYYAKLLVTSYWMWLAVLVVALVLVALARRRSGRPIDRGLLTTFVSLAVWAVAVVGVFSLMATKLAWYALAAYPALAVMTGIAVALALRGAGRVRLVALIAIVGIATVVAEVPIARAVTSTVADPAQSVLLSLHRDARFLGHHVYADPTSGWSPELVTAAELGGGLKPVDGAVEAALTDPGSLVLLNARSTDGARFADGLTSAVERNGDWALVPASALAAGAAG